MGRNIVLLVEDNSSDEILVRRALKKGRIEHELVVMRDGVEALEYLFGHGIYDGHGPDDLPRFILLDLKLPKLSGLEVLRQIRAGERTRTVPIVVFSSSGEEADLAESYGLGCNSYVRKPIAAVELNESLDRVMTYWLAVNVVPDPRWQPVVPPDLSLEPLPARYPSVAER